MDIADDAMPDDVGSVDNWLIGFIRDSIKEAANTDEAYDRLRMSWTFWTDHEQHSICRCQQDAADKQRSYESAGLC